MSKPTTIEIDRAIANLVAAGKKITTLNVRAELGTGSNSTIQEILRERGYISSKSIMDSTQQVNLQSPIQNNENSTSIENNLYKNQSFQEEQLSSANQLVLTDLQQKLRQAKKLEQELLYQQEQIKTLHKNKLNNSNALYNTIIDKAINEHLFAEIPNDLLMVLKQIRLDISSNINKDNSHKLFLSDFDNKSSEIKKQITQIIKLLQIENQP